MFIYCAYLENQEIESNPLLSEIAKLLPTLRSSITGNDHFLLFFVFLCLC